MASTLSERLSRLVKTMRGQARITESNVQDMLREVRMALLEADVALPVVRDFIARVKDKALGQEVVGALNPGQALVGIVHQLLFPVICDPDRAHFEAWGVGLDRSLLSTVKTLALGGLPELADGLSYGQGRVDGDPRQLPAWFVVGPGGRPPVRPRAAPGRDRKSVV